MLRKLFKYEFRYYVKFVLFSYIILIGLSLLTLGVYELSRVVYADSEYAFLIELPQFALRGLTLFLCFAVIYLPTVLFAVRFYQSMIKDQGYLSFTLPVTAAQHVFCKTVTPFLLSLLSIVVAVASAALTVIPAMGVDWKEFSESFSEFRITFGTEIIDVFLIQSLVSFILSILFTIVLICFSYAIGQLAKKHKFLLSVGCFAGVQFLVQTVNSIVQVFLIFLPTLGKSIEDERSFLAFEQTSLWSGVAISLIFGIVMYALSCRILNKRLNLE